MLSPSRNVHSSRCSTNAAPARPRGSRLEHRPSPDSASFQNGANEGMGSLPVLPPMAAPRLADKHQRLITWAKSHIRESMYLHTSVMPETDTDGLPGHFKTSKGYRKDFPWGQCLFSCLKDGLIWEGLPVSYNWKSLLESHAEEVRRCYVSGSTQTSAVERRIRQVHLAYTALQDETLVLWRYNRRSEHDQARWREMLAEGLRIEHTRLSVGSIPHPRWCQEALHSACGHQNDVDLGMSDVSDASTESDTNVVM
jgi:hypothetical protein